MIIIFVKFNKYLIRKIWVYLYILYISFSQIEITNIIYIYKYTLNFVIIIFYIIIIVQ